MIISHRYRYLFVELPHTASTAISKELCEQYAGTPILHKHAHCHEFLRMATEEEQAYFIFAGIRNPLDVAVTVYFKMKTNHQEFFTNPKYWRRNGGHVSDKALRQFHFIRTRDADFPSYFRTFHRLPYDSWGSPSPQDFDFVIRYEDLQGDFAELLGTLGIEQHRPLPVVNKTRGRRDDFRAYYPPEIRDQAKRMFGPYMSLWGYEFPPEWGDSSVSWATEETFHVLRLIRKRFIWASSPSARLFQLVRAKWRFIVLRIAVRGGAQLWR